MSSADASEEPATTSSPRNIATAGARFFWRNRFYVLRDLLFALLWVAVVSALFIAASLPAWLYYVLLFGGLLCYSMIVSLLGAAAELER